MGIMYIGPKSLEDKIPNVQVQENILILEDGYFHKISAELFAQADKIIEFCYEQISNFEEFIKREIFKKSVQLKRRSGSSLVGWIDPIEKEGFVDVLISCKKGDGSDLYKEFEDMCKANKIEKIKLQSVAESIGFWEKQGFRKVSGEGDRVFMQKCII